MTPEETAAFNAGIEAAAKIAEPAYRKRVPGTWAKRRIELAARIRTCKIENTRA